MIKSNTKDDLGRDRSAAEKHRKMTNSDMEELPRKGSEAPWQCRIPRKGDKCTGQLSSWQGHAA